MFRHDGIKLGRFLGIPVYLHPSWFIILFLFTLSFSRGVEPVAGAGSTMAVFAGFVTAVLAFASLLAHEYGHALTARAFGIGTDRITLFILGGVAHIREEPKTPYQELLIALAGPAVSLACVGVFGLPALLLNAAGVTPLLVSMLAILSVINLGFAIFNMIPGFPMDGGRVLRAAAWWASGSYLRATRIASIGGQTFSWFLIFVGCLYLFQLSLQGVIPLLLGLFLNRLARMSYRHAQMKSAFEALTVRDLMRPVQVVVPAELPVRSVVEEYIYKIHGDRFPVVRGSDLLGYISADEIASLDRRQWDDVRAERLARPYRRSEILSPYQNALAAFQKVSSLGRPNLPVFHERQLIGYLFQQDVMNYLERFSRLKG